MNGNLAAEVGTRIRHRRLANGQTQELVAGLAGITVDYLYQIERGRKLPALPVLVVLARVLRTDPGRLLGAHDTDTPPESPTRMIDLHRAMYARPDDAETLPLNNLRSQVEAAWRLWQISLRRHTAVGSILSGLIIEVERVRSESDNETARLTADLYGLVRTVAKRTGHSDLAAVAADRALQAATLANDALRVGAAWWNLARAMLAQGRRDVAEDAAMSAADRLATKPDPAAAAVRGSLLQVAAMAAALTGRASLARTRLQQADTLAATTGERNVLWTAFGPINVAMHKVSVEIEVGNLERAETLAARVAWERSPSIERRIAFLMDQADGLVRRRDYSAADRHDRGTTRHRPATHPRSRGLADRPGWLAGGQARFLSSGTSRPVTGLALDEADWSELGEMAVVRYRKGGRGTKDIRGICG